jgi:hypothetical protein
LIPAFNTGGIIPPHLGDPTQGDRSPYLTDSVELVQNLGFSAERRTILRGLLEYRKMLYDHSFTVGYQLINGSFVENCEYIRGRAPGDVDVFSVLDWPQKYLNDVDLFQKEAVPFLSSEAMGPQNKAKFKVDPYLVIQPGMSLRDYFQAFSHFVLLFSHQKGTDIWKGALSMALDPIADVQAHQVLQALEQA